MAKVILFDFDGTIADSFYNFLEILEILIKKYNLPNLSQSEFEELRQQAPKEIIKKLKIPFYKIPFIGRDLKRLQKDRIDNLKPVKNLPKILKTLKKQGYTLGILTSNNQKNAELFLKHNKLEVFSFIQGDIGLFNKASSIQKFLKVHKMSKEDVLYVGDEIRDIQACKKADIKIASVTWGFNVKKGLQRYNPDFLIDSPKELLDVAEKS